MIDLASTKEVGRAMAEAGYRVLPLYGVVYDSEEGELVCTCRNGSNCKSPGKHPYEPVAPRGALDASADVANIDRWPDGCNIGIVPSPTIAGIDIDDEGLAEKILARPDADQMTMVRTRRGVHIYIRCAPAQTQNLTENVVENGKTKRKHIGEIRVDNALLVLPPSRHVEDRLYAWVGPSLLDNKMPETTGTAFEWIKDLVEQHGVTLADRFDDASYSIPPESLDDADLPFEVDPNVNLKLYQLLTGTYPTTDRSGILYLMGCEIWRVAHEKNVQLEPAVVAGVLRKVDAIAWNKYTDRDYGRDRRYWETAIKTKAEVENEISLNGSSPSATTATRTWAWDPAVGFIFQGGQTPRRICNFEPLILTENHVIGEEGDLRTEWECRFTTTDGDVLNLVIRDRELGDFKRSILPRLPAHFIVSAREWANLEEGMRWYSRDTLTRRRVYGETGWLADRDAFLLPSVGGAITANGIDSTVVLSDDGRMPPTLKLYGSGMAKPDATFDVASVLRVLYDTAAPEVMVPLVTQAVAAPLASLDPTHTAVILHMLSRTGSYKTTIARIVISLYGSFPRGVAPETWTSTANSIQMAMNEYRDLPMVIDDYKSTLGRNHLMQMTALIQNYSDRTTRGRLSREQRNQKRLVARCLAISTGEDVWDGQESIMARTIIVDASRNPTTRERLSRAQRAVEDGRLAAVGYLWIEWLCRRGKNALRDLLKNKNAEKLQQLEGRDTKIHHARSNAAVAAMLTTDALWGDFIAEIAPGFIDEFRALRRTGWMTVMEDVSAQSEVALGYSPYEMLREAIRSALATGSVYLAPKNTRVTGAGVQGSPVIGFIDEDAVYLSERITLGWYRSEDHKRGFDTALSWTSIMQDGRQHHGVHPNKQVYVNHVGYEGQFRMAVCPREEFVSGLQIPDAQDIDDL